MQILIVEDNEVLANSMCRALHMLDPGKSFHIATNLRSARAFLEGGSDIDIALVDLGLPDAEGLEAPTALHMSRPDMPIIIISGGETSQLVPHLLRNGIEDYVPKSEASAARILRAINIARERQKRDLRLRNQNLVKTDSGALNKLGFYVAIQRCIECAERLKTRCGLLAICCDDDIDEQGTRRGTVGDLVLRHACARISRSIRQGDALGRGDDNMLHVLLNGISGVADLHSAAENILERFDEPLHLNTTTRISPRIGGALFPGRGTTVREWLRRAKEALDMTLTDSHGRIVVYEDHPADPESQGSTEA